MMQNGHEPKSTPIFKIKDLNELNLDQNSVLLIKLPKELVDYQKTGADLKLNFSKLKSGNRFKVVGLSISKSLTLGSNIDPSNFKNKQEYEATVRKAKEFSSKSLSFLLSDSDQLKTVNKFKYVVEIRKSLDMPEITPPPAESKQVDVPEPILNYVKKRSALSQTSELSKPNKKKKK